MAPHQRHVFVSPDLRFFVWRAPEGDNKDIKSVFLPHAAGIQPGLAEDNMRRSSVNPEHCFSVFGLLRNVTMEVDSIHERDKWVDSLRAVIRFNEQVQLMKYGQSGEDVGPVELGSDKDIEKRGREKAAMLLAEEEERKYEAQYGASAAGVSIEIV